MDTVHEFFMRRALEQASRAGRLNEVPIGAVVVQNVTSASDNDKNNDLQQFRILASQRNRVEACSDASAHAELLALRGAASAIRNWRLSPSVTLYSTLEPCPMCLAAAQAFRVSHIVYGAPDHRLGAVTTHMNLLGVAQHPYHTITSIHAGVLDEECGSVLVQFFRERRGQSKGKLPI
jgi:tRNA(adenine34) deaminase